MQLLIKSLPPTAEVYMGLSLPKTMESTGGTMPWARLTTVSQALHLWVRTFSDWWTQVTKGFVSLQIPILSQEVLAQLSDD